MLGPGLAALSPQPLAPNTAPHLGVPRSLAPDSPIPKQTDRPGRCLQELLPVAPTDAKNRCSETFRTFSEMLL